MAQQRLCNYEDNFGFWCFDRDDTIEQAFYDHVIAQSRTTRCKRCHIVVRLQPDRFTCASCIEAREYGAK